MLPKIITKTGPLPGKTLAIFAGVHGNEPIGILALEKASHEIAIAAGTVHFVIAHPQAVQQNVRSIEKNLNRCFVPGNDGTSLEDRLAKKLMKLLDTCDALLDLHGYNGPEDQPFLICEPASFDLAKQLDFGIVSSGWSVAQPGATEGYMDSHGKIGVCVECGSNFQPEKYVPLAEKTIIQFLGYFGAIDLWQPSTRKQKIIAINRFHKKQNATFALYQDFQNFDPLQPGAIFGTDGATKLKAGPNECIIFPRPNAKIGEEAFVIGTVKI